MRIDRLINDYFEWMYDVVVDETYSRRTSYRRLLMCLHDIDFVSYISKDENRAEDGIALRQKFGYDQRHKDASLYLDGPCSVLEMMIALAMRCENNIMQNTDIGNRTGQWFWNMIVSLGLGSMTDNRFRKDVVNDIVYDFLERHHSSDGRGSLFTIPNCKHDLREVEIWFQMCLYLENVVEV